MHRQKIKNKALTRQSLNPLRLVLCRLLWASVWDGWPGGGAEWHRSGGTELSALQPNYSFHWGCCSLIQPHWKCLRLSFYLPQLAALPPHPPCHHPAQAEKHHLVQFVLSGVQQWGRQFIHQHGDLQPVFTEINSVIVVLLVTHMSLTNKAT